MVSVWPQWRQPVSRAYVLCDCDQATETLQPRVLWNYICCPINDSHLLPPDGLQPRRVPRSLRTEWRYYSSMSTYVFVSIKYERVLMLKGRGKRFCFFMIMKEPIQNYCDHVTDSPTSCIFGALKVKPQGVWQRWLLGTSAPQSGTQFVPSIYQVLERVYREPFRLGMMFVGFPCQCAIAFHLTPRGNFAN